MRRRTAPYRCDFCGREAKYQFKTGKKSLCCEDNVSKCPAIKEINAEKHRKRIGWHHSKETKARIRQTNLGQKRSEETKAKLRKPKSEEHKAKLRKPKSEEHKAKLRKPKSEETKRKLSESLKGRKDLVNSGSWQHGNIAWNKGKTRSEETKRKISESHIGKVLSLGHRQAIGNSHKGQKRSEETRMKMSLAASGEKSSQWKGGIACEPYGDIWLDKEYKDLIKERDNHQCQNPDCTGNFERLCIHHIDYVKKNCYPDNLITLCLSCNSKANANREYWQELYQGIIYQKKFQKVVNG